MVKDKSEVLHADYNLVCGEDCESGGRDVNPRRVHLYSSVAILNIAYIIVGTSFAWSSPMLMKLQLSDSDASTVASLMSLGGVFGPFVTGVVVDRMGRKGTAVLAMSLATASYVLLTLRGSVWVLATGRFLAGVSYATIVSTLPMYIAEISEPAVRGILNNINVVSTSSGCLVMFAVAPFVSYELIHYMMLGLCASFFLLFPLLPESPYYLVMNDNTHRARDTLNWLRENRPAPLVEKELLVIEKTIIPQQQGRTGSVRELFSSPGNRRAFIICSTLLTLQHLAGISFVIYYMQEIFEKTGADISSSVCSIIFGLIKLGAGFFCPFAVKRLGYRVTLMVSMVGSGVGMVGLGVFFLLKTNNFDVSSLSWLPLLSLAAYIFFLVSGFSNIPWALSGELFPNNVKSIAACLITVLSCTSSFMTSKMFPSLTALIGMEFLFFICSLFCCLSVIFVALVVEETSDLTFVQIQELLNGRKRKDILMEEPK